MKNALLWEIRFPGTETPSYLFGTMHVRDARAFKNIDQLTKIIAKCEVFAAEFNLSDADPAAANDAITLPDGKTLADVLGKSLYKKVERLIKKQMGVPIDLFENKTPFFILNALTENALGSESPHALDEALHIAAAKLGCRLDGLETFDSQLETLSEMPMKDHVKTLKDMACNFRRFKKQLQHVADLYAKGDLEGLLKSTKSQMKGMRRLLLYDRNEVMASRIMEITQKETLFAAIGAAHLPGGKGVLRLLKKNGYKVKAVKI